MGIYKYMKTKTYDKNGETNLLKKVFEDKTLRFTSPLSFNDPFEFRYPVKYLSPSSSVDLNNLVNSLFNNNQFNNIALDFVLKGIGILSLSASNDDILMWSHYADHHKGIVLEFYEDHSFFSESTDDKKLIHNLEEVNYQIDRPYPKNEEEYFLDKSMYLTKHINWEGEQESRVAVLLDEAGNDDKYNIKFPTDLIKSVYIGVRTDNDDIKYIVNLKQKEEWRHLNIYKLKMDEKDYKLNTYIGRFKR